MHFAGKAANVDVNFLFDSGADDNFVSKSFAQMHGIFIEPYRIRNLPLQKSTTSHTFMRTSTLSKLLVTSHALTYHTRSFSNLTTPNHFANYIHI
jgi:hypothetical protein